MSTATHKKEARRSARQSKMDNDRHVDNVVDRYLRMLKVQAELDKGCWIMLIKELPVKRPPPPLSIHYSHAWPMEAHMRHQVKRRVMEDDLGGSGLVRSPLGGAEPNLVTARKILWKGGEYRVFDHEYSVLTAEKMNLYIQGYPDMPKDERPTHAFRDGQTLAEKMIASEIMDGEKRFIYDAALIDGCTHEQAFLVAMGKDPLELTEFPPAVGWYECQPEYLNVFF